MPDFWTHIISGQKIIAGLEDEQLKDILRDKMTYYNFGCQGPDFLFFNNFFPWEEDKTALKVAEMIHQKNTKEMLEELIEYLKKIYENDKISQNSKNIILAYTAGFLAHYSLDMKAHPFVYAHDGEGDRHKRIEMSIDIYIVKKEWGTEADFLKPVDYINIGEELAPQIRELYYHILDQIYNYNGDMGFIADSYLDFKKFHNIFYSPFKFKYILFKILNIFLKEDISLYSYSGNASNNILEEEDLKVFYQYFEKGIKQGIDLVDSLYKFLNFEIEYKELSKKIPNINFLGRKN